MINAKSEKHIVTGWKVFFFGGLLFPVSIWKSCVNLLWTNHICFYFPMTQLATATSPCFTHGRLLVSL